MELRKYTLENKLTLRRYYVDLFYARHIPSVPKGAHVLDLGGHKIRRRGFFDVGGYDLQVTYANLTRDRLPDVQADGMWLPISASSFDAVICSELLEHVEDPVAVLRETYRVLKSGGQVLLTAPFLYPIHADPWDFCRFTDHFWRNAMEGAGFQVTAIEPQGLLFSVMMDFVRLYVDEVDFLGTDTKLTRRVLKRILAFLAQLAVKQEAKHVDWGSEYIGSFTTGFGVVAVKP
jgi:ubiquinone/menaquinone biosynthesis C-methylase UbiE